jgi:hypothetical protein
VEVERLPLRAVGRQGAQDIGPGRVSAVLGEQPGDAQPAVARASAAADVQTLEPAAEVTEKPDVGRLVTWLDMERRATT